MNWNRKIKMNVFEILFVGLLADFALPVTASESGNSHQLSVPGAEADRHKIYESGHKHQHSADIDKDKDKAKKDMTKNQDASKATQHENESDHDTHQHESELPTGSATSVESKAASNETDNDGSSFELTETAATTLGITYKDISPVKGSIYIVPNQAIVRYQDKIGVYTKRKTFYSLLMASSVQSKGNDIAVKIPGGSGVEKIVVSGVALLRVAHLQAAGQGGQGHVH